MAKAKEEIPVEVEAPTETATEPGLIKGSGSGKNVREFTATYTGSAELDRKSYTVVGVCDESEAMRLLRLVTKTNPKNGGFRIVETDASLAASKKRLADREEAKKTRPATGGL